MPVAPLLDGVTPSVVNPNAVSAAPAPFALDGTNSSDSLGEAYDRSDRRDYVSPRRIENRLLALHGTELAEKHDGGMAITQSAV